MKNEDTIRMNNLFKQKYRVFNFFILVLFSMSLFSCSEGNNEMPETETPEPIPTIINFMVSVPCEGNSWVFENPLASQDIVVEGGIKNWTNSSYKIRTYFYAKKTGAIELGLRAKFNGDTTLKISLNGETQEVSFSEKGIYEKHSVGKFNIDKLGYHYIELEGVSKSGNSFGDISDILLGETAWNSKIDYVNSDWFYWGRRGPSVHLAYEKPSSDVTWFYNEVMVPEGNDIVGSYYMANGFSGGYFGMQVNSETERRILFSVWSAFDTQDPNQIPSEYTVQPLGSGTGVTVGEFGGEGSGAQSYFLYNWKAGTTYKFLLKGESNSDNTTDYTAYFYAPEVGDWQLISSFRRPYPSDSHLTGLYSFLENFQTSAGDSTRKVNFGNQWVYSANGAWSEMTSAKFTIDNTGRSGVRFDYDGGINGDGFYLRNCGFFSDNTAPDTPFTRTVNGTSPAIDFSQLETPSIPIDVSITILDRSSWSIINYSSMEDKGGEGNTGLANDILDGDLSTYWHSCWQDCEASPPHHITIDMGISNTIDGFSFTQRQSLSRAVKDIEIQISSDNVSWESLGDIELQNVAKQQGIDLSESKTFRYFKFIAKTAYDGTDNAALAEIGVYNK